MKPFVLVVRNVHTVLNFRYTCIVNLPLAILLKKCQVFGNFLTVKWQFSGGSAVNTIT